MHSDTDILEYLSRRLTTWDQDLRWGHRGVEQFQMFLQDFLTQSQVEQRGQDSEPNPWPRCSQDDLETALSSEMLAEFRMLAMGYLMKVPALLAALDECEARLHADRRASSHTRHAG